MESELKRLKKINNQLIEDIENKEKSIIGLTKDKEEMLIELAAQKREFRNFKEHYNELYCEKRYHNSHCEQGDSSSESKKRWTMSKKTVQTDFGTCYPREHQKISELIDENHKLKIALHNLFQTKKKVCEKFLKMKRTKDTIKNQLDQFKETSNQTISELVDQLTLIKKENFDLINNQLSQNTSHDTKKIVNLMRQNSEYEHELWLLKHQMSQMEYSIKHLPSNPSSTTIQTDESSISFGDIDSASFSLLDPQWELPPKSDVLSMNGYFSAPDRIETQPFNRKNIQKLFNDYKQLFLSGELDNALLPVNRLNTLNSSTMNYYPNWGCDKDVDNIIKIDDNRYIIVKVPPHTLKDPFLLNADANVVKCQLHLIKLSPNTPGDYWNNIYEHGTRIGLLTMRKLPKICKYSLYIHSGEITVQISTNVNELFLSKAEFESIKHYNVFMYRDVANCFKPFFLFSATEKTSNLLVVPLDLNNRLDFNIIHKYREKIEVKQLTYTERKNINIAR